MEVLGVVCSWPPVYLCHVAGPRQDRVRRVRHARRAVPARVIRCQGLHLQAARRRPGEADERGAGSSSPVVAPVDEVRYVPRGVFSVTNNVAHQPDVSSTF